jgi:hypothetical protein
MTTPATANGRGGFMQHRELTHRVFLSSRLLAALLITVLSKGAMTPRYEMRFGGPASVMSGVCDNWLLGGGTSDLPSNVDARCLARCRPTQIITNGMQLRFRRLLGSINVRSFTSVLKH